jgi:hypothetical protein
MCRFLLIPKARNYNVVLPPKPTIFTTHGLIYLFLSKLLG